MREDFDSSMEPPDDPIIVCLCGSGRFKDAFDQAEFDETVAGKIVLTIGCNTKDIARDGNFDHLKPMLDELHKRKIDLADEVLILNVGGYIGDSTRSEIEYAKQHGKTIRWLEQPQPAPVPTLVEAVTRCLYDLNNIVSASTSLDLRADMKSIFMELRDALAREQRLAPLREKVIAFARLAYATHKQNNCGYDCNCCDCLNLKAYDEEAAK